MIYMQASSQWLMDTARLIEAGELNEYEGFANNYVLITFMNAIVEAAQENEPPQLLEKDWDRLVAQYKKTLEIMGQWFNGEILSTTAVEMLSPVLEQMDEILVTGENRLAHEFDFDPALLSQQRQAAIDSISELTADYR